MGDLVINPFLTKESTVPSPIRAKEKMDKNCKKKFLCCAVLSSESSAMPELSGCI